MSTRVILVTLALTVALTMAAVHLDRRVVDVVNVGDAESEATHGFAGEAMVPGRLDGLTHSASRGWMHFALKTFDDTDVTVELTLVNTDTLPRSFDLVVEDTLVATRTVAPRELAPLIVPFAVPFARTKGKSHVIIIIRARDGLTPGVRRLRTIQDHYEVDLSTSPLGVVR